MKKVININFQGRVVMIEEEAYEKLKAYIESLRKHFANEDGCDEIINDIENRISELFEEVIKRGSPCVSENDLEAIIHSIGRPEDFEEEENTASTPQQQPSENQSQQTTVGGHKQFFRDETNKKLGGVCAGIANYFNIDPTLVRLIALILLVCYGVGFV
ncbi:MAG TPA: PspC domain-containing protein, partial [Arachidicoccus sp.]